MDTLTPRDFTISSRQFDEDQEWFGLQANPSGVINVPVTDPYSPQNRRTSPAHYERS